MRTRDELDEIGRAIVIARQTGVPWKLLEQQYGNGRTWLWTLYRAALEELGRPVPPDERCSLNISTVAMHASSGKG